MYLYIHWANGFTRGNAGQAFFAFKTKTKAADHIIKHIATLSGVPFEEKKSKDYWSPKYSYGLNAPVAVAAEPQPAFPDDEGDQNDGPIAVLPKKKIKSKGSIDDRDSKEFETLQNEAKYALKHPSIENAVKLIDTYERYAVYNSRPSIKHGLMEISVEE